MPCLKLYKGFKFFDLKIQICYSHFPSIFAGVVKSSAFSVELFKIGLQNHPYKA
jgi:hypothetical protein